MLIGLLCAAVAALAYGAATILQKIGVRYLADEAGGSLVRRLWAGRLYGIGLVLDGAGFIATVVALRRLPLFLVESAVASSVGVTAVLAVIVLKVRLSRPETIALCTSGLGLVLLSVSAEPGPATRVGRTADWLVFATVLLVGALFAYGVREAEAVRSSIALAVAGGLGFGFVGIAARTLRVDTPWWHTVTNPAMWAIAGNGVLSVVAYGYALHRGKATTVAAVTFAVETVVPAAIGLAWLGDAVRPHLGVLAAAGFVATVGGCVALAGQAEPPAPLAPPLPLN